MPTRDEIEWDSDAPNSGAGTVYDVLKGETGTLPVGGASESCLGPGTASTTMMDTTIPPSGAAYYYLVRGSNVCAVGTYGFDSGLIERVSSACP